MSKQLIAEALAGRLIEVRERIRRLDPHSFGDMTEFVLTVKDASVGPPVTAPEFWMEADVDCLASLRALSVDQLNTTREVARPPVEVFFEELKIMSAERRPLFEPVAERYRCPLNFSLAGEDDIREFILTKLMTSFRTRIEKGSIATIDADDLLLLLNLVAVHAATMNDLRFLDALNYYYELLPETWHPEAQHPWLLVSYLALYARALISCAVTNSDGYRHSRKFISRGSEYL